MRSRSWEWNEKLQQPPLLHPLSSKKGRRMPTSEHKYPPPLLALVRFFGMGDGAGEEELA